MAIEIPGYEAVIENQVYARGMTLVLNGQSVDVKCLLLPRRYTEATKDQVVEYLPKKAEELAPTAAVIIPGQKFEGKSKLEMILLQIAHSSANVFNDIRTGNPEYMDFIRRKIIARALEEGESQRQYCSVRYGAVPVKTIEENRAKGNIKGAEWYDSALSHEPLIEQDLGEKVGIRFLLDAGALPAREAVEGQLNEGFFGSKILKVRPEDYEVDDVMPIVDLVYSALSTPRQMETLPDSSTAKVEDAAMKPLFLLLEMAENQNKRKRMEAAMAAAGQQQGLPPGMRIVMLRKPGQ